MQKAKIIDAGNYGGVALKVTSYLVLGLTMAWSSLTPCANAQGAAAAKTLKTLAKIVEKNPKAIGLAATVIAMGGGAAAFNAHLASGEAAYSVEFDLNNDASVIKWADVFSKPDVFPILQVQGEKTYLIPEVMTNYAGGKVIWTFKIPKIAAGRGVTIFLMDDDSTSDELWNNIAKTRWAVNLQGKLIYCEGIELGFGAKGQIQLVNKNLVIDARDQLCAYTLTTPRFFLAGDWDSEGDLIDEKGRHVGTMKFSQVVNK